MGCDIWTFVERRTPDGVWEPAGIPTLDGRYGVLTDEQVDWHEENTLDGWLERRCYAFFCILSGVRCCEDNPPGPLAADRGLPDDATVSESKLGDWGYSWVGGEELAAFPWRDHVPHVAEEIIPRLRELGPLADIRILFGFDN